MKKANAIVRKHFKADPENVTDRVIQLCITELGALKYDLKAINAMLKPNSMGRVVAFESWELTNLGAEIKRLRVRNEE